MRGWHSQRLLGNGEVGDPIIKVWWNFEVFIFIFHFLFSYIHRIVQCFSFLRIGMLCLCKSVKSSLRASVWSSIPCAINFNFVGVTMLDYSRYWIMHFIDSDVPKRKSPSYMDNAVKAARSKPSRPQLRHAYSFLYSFYCVLWLLTCLCS